MKNNFFVIICLLILNSCGYQITNLQNDFNINSIVTEGDKRINFKIKNKLLSTNSSSNKNFVTITLNSKKNKVIKEKNISNQITKYEITILSIISFETLDNNSKGSFSITKKGDFSVSKKYSDTLNNEKNLVNSLIIDLVEEIQESLATALNDS